MLLMVFQQSHYHLRQQGPSSIMLLLLRRRPYVASTSEAMADTAADGVNIMMMMEVVSRATIASVASDRWFLDSTVHHVTQFLFSSQYI